MSAVAEEWRPIPGYEGRYEASSFGRIRSLRNIGNGYDTARAEPLVLKANLDRKGYLYVTLYEPGARHTRQVHRLVCLSFHGPPPTPGHTAAHRDGCKVICRADNLRWATWAEQGADKQRHGTPVRRERHPAAKLTADQVEAIRAQAGEKSQRCLAREYGVGQPHISSIIRGANWS